MNNASDFDATITHCPICGAATHASDCDDNDRCVACAIKSFPADVRDRACEWVNANVEIDEGDDFDHEYDLAVLSACGELTAIDAAADRADRLAAS
jgi:hypothetical protein